MLCSTNNSNFFFVCRLYKLIHEQEKEKEHFFGIICFEDNYQNIYFLQFSVCFLTLLLLFFLHLFHNSTMNKPNMFRHPCVFIVYVLYLKKKESYLCFLFSLSEIFNFLRTTKRWLARYLF
jgi:hypothetical protein